MRKLKMIVGKRSNGKEYYTYNLAKVGDKVNEIILMLKNKKK